MLSRPLAYLPLKVVSLVDWDTGIAAESEVTALVDEED